MRKRKGLDETIKDPNRLLEDRKMAVELCE